MFCRWRDMEKSRTHFLRLYSRDSSNGNVEIEMTMENKNSKKTSTKKIVNEICWFSRAVEFQFNLLHRSRKIRGRVTLKNRERTKIILSRAWNHSSLNQRMKIRFRHWLMKRTREVRRERERQRRGIVNRKLDSFVKSKLWRLLGRRRRFPTFDLTNRQRFLSFALFLL